MSFRRLIPFRLIFMLIFLLLVLVPRVVAATFIDIFDNDYAEPVKRLAALGVITGDPEGVFRPYAPIIRAEFAAAVVRALGVTQEQARNGASNFTDVSEGDWYSGWVNAAVKRGVVLGYPDGTFRPERPVTYAEAVTMLVRALGYEPLVKGLWPTGHIAKALELGLTVGTSFQAHSPISRADFALMLDRAVVETGVAERVPYAAQGLFQITSRTLAREVHGYTETEGVVTGVPATHEGLEPKAFLLGQARKELDGTETVPNVNELLGMAVRVGEKEFPDGQRRVIYVRVLTPPGRVLKGYIAAKPSSPRLVGGSRLNITTLQGETEDYTLADNPLIFKNYVAFTGSLPAGAHVTLLLDDRGEARFLAAKVYDPANALINRVEVKGVGKARATALEVTAFRNSYYYTRVYNEWEIAPNVMVTRDGKTATLADLKVDDIVSLALEGNVVRVIDAASNSLTGILEMVVRDSNGAVTEIMVNGRKYPVLPYAQIQEGILRHNRTPLAGNESLLVRSLGRRVTLGRGVDGKTRLITVWP